MFLVIFIWFGRIRSFAYIPTSGIKTNVVHSQKLFWWVRLFLEFLKIVLRRVERPQGMRENKMRLVKFELQETQV